MELRKLGRSGLDVSAISLGCWVMGGAQWGGADDEESIETIRLALRSGVNFLDTAEGYGGGHSERVVGQALSGGQRERVSICTKVGATPSEDEILRHLEASLQRLQTDAVEVYMIHWPHRVPIGPMIESLDRIRRRGYFQAIGVSNFTVEQLKEALQVARVEVAQMPYNLFFRHIERDVLPVCVANEIGIMAYSPLCRGLLTGKFTRDWQFPKGDDRRRDVHFRPGNFEICLDAVEALKAVAQRMNKTVSQLAVAWILRNAGITTAVVGARRPDQLQDNLGGTDVMISDDVAAEMDEICRPVLQMMAPYPNPFDVTP